MILASHGIVGSQIVQIVPVFEFSVKTDNAGVSTSTEFRMPLTTSTGLDMNVDWGDGSPIENITDYTLAIHDYGTVGTYTIKVTGSILGWSFNNGGDRLKMLDVKQWEGLNISVDKGFLGCTNLTATATDAPLITSTSLFQYFALCSVFNSNINNWDVSLVGNFGSMFSGATIFNQDISNWDVSSATSFASMFRSCPFNQPIGNWNTSLVTSINSMFRSAPFNQDISNWDINQITDFSLFMTLSPGFSTANYDALLVAWEAQAPITGRSVNFGGSKYTLASAAETARASLIATYGWTITDGGGI
jgi:surface protein